MIKRNLNISRNDLNEYLKENPLFVNEGENEKELIDELALLKMKEDAEQNNCIYILGSRTPVKTSSDYILMVSYMLFSKS